MIKKINEMFEFRDIIANNIHTKVRFNNGVYQIRDMVEHHLNFKFIEERVLREYNWKKS